MKAIKESKLSTKIFVVFLIIAAIVPAFIQSSYIISIFFMTALYALLSTGWNILGGFTGQLGLGLGLYFSMGAYITGALYNFYNMNTWLAMVIAAVVVTLVSIIIGLICFPLKSAYFGLATIAVLSICKIVFYNNDYVCGIKFGGGIGIKITWKGGFANMQFVDKHYYYYIVLVLLVLALLFSHKVINSKPGFYFRAISTNEQASSTLGINVTLYKCIAQCMSAFIMALGGGVYVMYIMFIEPQTMFSMEYCLNILLMTYVGGIGELFGPLLGSVILQPVYEIVRSLFGSALPGIASVFYGILLMLCMAFFPKGIIPAIRKYSERRRAQKNTAAAETGKKV